MNSFMTKLKAFLLLVGSNPIFQWIYKVGRDTALGYVGSSPFVPTKAWVVGLAVAVASGLIHAFDIWLQQQLANNQSPVAPSAQPPVASHMAMLKSQLKMILFLVGIGLLASTANAGYLLSPNKSQNVALTLPSGTAIYAMSIEGFDVGAGLPKPTYGISLNEDLVFATQSSLNGGTNLAPIFGVGASLYLDGADVVNGTGPLELLGGVNVIGPDLDILGLGNGQGLVPNALFVWNFQTGERKITGGLTVFADLGPGTAVKLAGK